MEIAKIKCPLCEHVRDVDVPENICLQFYRCDNCGKQIQTPDNSCCLICAYSDKKCRVSILK